MERKIARCVQFYVNNQQRNNSKINKNYSSLLGSFFNTVFQIGFELLRIDAISHKTTIIHASFCLLKTNVQRKEENHLLSFWFHFLRGVDRWYRWAFSIIAYIITITELRRWLLLATPSWLTGFNRCLVFFFYCLKVSNMKKISCPLTLVVGSSAFVLFFFFFVFPCVCRGADLLASFICDFFFLRCPSLKHVQSIRQKR